MAATTEPGMERRPYIPYADDEILPDTAANVLYRFDRGGFPGSSGEKALLDVAVMCSPEIVDLLALGFPGMVEAVRLARTEGGIDRLGQIMRGQ